MSIDPKFVKKGDPITAEWANDMVRGVRKGGFPSQGKEFVNESATNGFAPLYHNYNRTDGNWETKLQPAYVVECLPSDDLTEHLTVRDIYFLNESGDYVVLDERPLVAIETGQTLCVEFEADKDAFGVIKTGDISGDPYPRLSWFEGLLADGSLDLSQENYSVLPEATDTEYINRFDNPPRDGKYVYPVLGFSGAADASGNAKGVTVFQHNPSNIYYTPPRRWSARDAYNTGQALQVLMVDENNVENHQSQHEPFYLRTITGQESGSQMVRNPDKSSIIFEYAGETVEGEADTATMITGYNLLRDIDGSLTLKSGTTELGKIDWTDSLMDTDDDIVVDLANLNKNRDGDTGDILLQEGTGAATTLISADNGVVDVIANETIYVRSYKVCENGTVVTKKFLCLD